MDQENQMVKIWCGCVQFCLWRNRGMCWPGWWPGISKLSTHRPPYWPRSTAYSDSISDLQSSLFICSSPSAPRNIMRYLYRKCQVAIVMSGLVRFESEFWVLHQRDAAQCEIVKKRNSMRERERERERERMRNGKMEETEDGEGRWREIKKE